MIRRAFWLGAGAAAGILGYRRVAAFGRRLSPGARAGGARLGGASASGAGVAARQRHAVRDTIRFARDVRAGMDIYASRHALPSGIGSASGRSTTSGRSIASGIGSNLDRKDGR